jgi:replicative DNA helicase
MEKFNDLKEENNKLAFLISKAEQEQNHDEAIKLKKKLYTNKLLMIEMITIEEKRNGITARELRRLVDLRPKAIRYETGIRPLDDKFKGGIELGTFVQLAGESGVGKTHLTLEILTNIAIYTKSVFFNFEMGDTRIVKRLKNIIKEEQQWDNLIIDNDSREIEVLCNEITLYANEGIKFFTIDSKMKINVDTAEADHQKFSKISKRLAELSQKQDIIIFLINQMNEEDIKHKRLAFKGSGDQKYDADIALFYVRDDDGNRRLICNKNRQDEYEFTIDLKLNASGKTIDQNEIYPVHEEVYQMPAV